MKKEGKKPGLNKRNLVILAVIIVVAVLCVLAFNFGKKFGLDFSKGATEFSAENYTSDEFMEGIIKELNISEVFEFKVDKKSHSISVKEMTDNNATIIVKSEPLELTLSIGGEVKIELTGDNYYDIYMKLNSIAYRKANFVIKGIKEKKEKIPVTPGESSGGDGGSAAESEPVPGNNPNQNNGAQGSSCANACTSGYNQYPAPNCSCYPVDTDGDGIKDVSDNFPNNPLEWLDTDNDSIGNNADTDDDNDGHTDAADAFPLNSGEWIDTDNDSIGNNADTDDDNDNHTDAADAFPLNSGEWLDTDNDSIGNNADTDDDNDGVLDGVDINPLDATITGKIGGQYLNDDFDNDSITNMYDSDDDGDGIDDTADLAPFNSSDTRHWVCITCRMNWDTAAYGMGPLFSGYYIGSFDTLSEEGYHVHEMKAEAKVSDQYPGTSVRYKWDINGNGIWDGTINLADGWKNCGTASNLNPNINYRYQDGRYNLGQPVAGILIKVSAIVD